MKMENVGLSVEEPRTGGQIQPQALKGSVTGNTDLDNYTYYLVE
jgi:hypothetical protein